MDPQATTRHLAKQPTHPSWEHNTETEPPTTGNDQLVAWARQLRRVSGWWLGSVWAALAADNPTAAHHRLDQLTRAWLTRHKGRSEILATITAA